VDPFETQHLVSGPNRLRNPQTHRVRTIRTHLDALEFFQGLHAALNLPCLARLVPEPLDEPFRFGDAPILRGAIREQLVAPFGAVFEIAVVAAFVDGKPPRIEIGDSRRVTPQEGPVTGAVATVSRAVIDAG
jgi:hypothetical protein